MSDLIISTVKSKKDLTDFIKLPWDIYTNNPYWVPHLKMDRKKILDKKKNPFFLHAEAEYFLAKRNNKAAGRIAAIKNDLHNKEHNDKAGFFGFFECENNQETANKLFDSAKEWLKSKGLSIVRGPANPSSNEEYGLLVDGFEDPPRLLMPYNPPYYISLIENYGFRKAKDLYAYKLENKKVLASDKLRRVNEIARQRSGIKIRELDMKNFSRELEIFKDVYNKTWEPNWGFVPMTAEEIDAMAKDLKPLVEPSLVLFGEINNKIIGFGLVMLDYNQIIKELNGKLFPFGFIKLLTQKKKIKWARIIALGILPEYQRKGLDAVFYWEIVNRAHDLGIDLGEASWILEDNEMMNRGAKMMNGEIYKTYRIYEIEV